MSRGRTQQHDFAPLPTCLRVHSTLSQSPDNVSFLSSSRVSALIHRVVLGAYLTHAVKTHRPWPGTHRTGSFLSSSAAHSPGKRRYRSVRSNYLQQGFGGTASRKGNAMPTITTTSTSLSICKPSLEDHESTRVSRFFRSVLTLCCGNDPTHDQQRPRPLVIVSIHFQPSERPLTGPAKPEHPNRLSTRANHPARSGSETVRWRLQTTLHYFLIGYHLHNTFLPRQTLLQTKQAADAQKMWSHLSPLQSSPSDQFASPTNPAPIRVSYDDFTVPRSPIMPSTPRLSDLRPDETQTRLRWSSGKEGGERFGKLRKHSRNMSDSFLQSIGVAGHQQAEVCGSNRAEVKETFRLARSEQSGVHEWDRDSERQLIMDNKF